MGGRDKRRLREERRAVSPVLAALAWPPRTRRGLRAPAGPAYIACTSARLLIRAAQGGVSVSLRPIVPVVRTGDPSAFGQEVHRICKRSALRGRCCRREMRRQARDGSFAALVATEGPSALVMRERDLSMPSLYRGLCTLLVCENVAQQLALFCLGHSDWPISAHPSYKTIRSSASKVDTDIGQKSSRWATTTSFCHTHGARRVQVNPHLPPRVERRLVKKKGEREGGQERPRRPSFPPLPSPPPFTLSPVLSQHGFR